MAEFRGADEHVCSDPLDNYLDVRTKERANRIWGGGGLSDFLVAACQLFRDIFCSVSVFLLQFLSGKQHAMEVSSLFDMTSSSAFTDTLGCMYSAGQCFNLDRLNVYASPQRLH